MRKQPGAFANKDRRTAPASSKRDFGVSAAVHVVVYLWYVAMQYSSSV